MELNISGKMIADEESKFVKAGSSVWKHLKLFTVFRL